MYAQYFPKDLRVQLQGHRHDSEEVVVFVDHNGNSLKAAVSSHGGYKTKDRYENPQFWDGNRVKTSYGSGGVRNNAMRFNESKGESPPMLDWDLMNRSYRKTVQGAISNTHWGKVAPKFISKGGVFGSKVREAWNS